MVHNLLFKILAIALFISIGISGVALAGDRHAGYNYPEPQTEELYKSVVPPIPGVNRRSRISFIVGLDQLQKKNPYPPDYHMYAKGAESEKLIIVAVEEGRYNTLYRLRALLASMTSDARRSPLFAKIGQVERLGFYDLTRMAGFKWITITNGKDISHRVVIE